MKKCKRFRKKQIANMRLFNNQNNQKALIFFTLVKIKKVIKKCLAVSNDLKNLY